MYTPLLISRQSRTKASGLILGLVCATMVGCQTVGQRELVPPDHVRLVHSETHCKDINKVAALPFPDADHVETMVMGQSALLSLSGSVWTWTARQLAVERDADLSLIRPCDGAGSYGMKFAQIEVWRTRGFTAPTTQGEPRPGSGTLVAPSRTTYGRRIQNIFECFEQARTMNGPVSTENRQRLGNINATDYFTSDRHFPGYARIDRYYRPTRTGELSLTGIIFDRVKADWAAGIYRKLSAVEKHYFAESYLVCLLDLGYGWRPIKSSNKAPAPKSGAAKL